MAGNEYPILRRSHTKEAPPLAAQTLLAIQVRTLVVTRHVAGIFPSRVGLRV